MFQCHISEQSVELRAFTSTTLPLVSVLLSLERRRKLETAIHESKAIHKFFGSSLTDVHSICQFCFWKVKLVANLLMQQQVLDRDTPATNPITGKEEVWGQPTNQPTEPEQTKILQRLAGNSREVQLYEVIAHPGKSLHAILNSSGKCKNLHHQPFSGQTAPQLRYKCTAYPYPLVVCQLNILVIFTEESQI